MLSRRLFFGMVAGALWSSVAKAKNTPDIFFLDDEIAVVDGWVLTREEAAQRYPHAF